VINPSQKPLPDNTQHSQQTNIHAPSVIRNQNLSRRAAEDLRLRTRGHWDRHIHTYTCVYIIRPEFEVMKIFWSHFPKIVTLQNTAFEYFGTLLRNYVGKVFIALTRGRYLENVEVCIDDKHFQ